MKFLSLIAFLICSATASFAHSRMDSTTPANGAVLESAPSEIVFGFSDKLRLTKVEATHSSGEIQPLDLEGNKSFTNAVTLPLPRMGPGSYNIEWRGLGIDGHAMQGSFHFEVK